MEYFDIVDERDNVIGTASRLQCHRSPSLIHRTVHVFVFNNRKQLFVQKRGNDVDLYPGCYDSSASGHVHAGGNYGDTAFRELNEELGIEPEMVIPLFKVKLSDDKQTEFVKLFFCFHNGQVKPNPKELDGGEFMDVAEIKRKIDDGGKFTYFFKEVFLKYYDEFWNRNGDEENSH